MNNIQIESYSLNRYGSSDEDDLSRDYFPMDMVFDNHTFDYNIPVFISAGNQKDRVDNDIVSPAKAFNVITVGNYGFDENESLLLHPSSSFHNPLLDGNLSKSYQKPELSAPGTNYHVVYQDSSSNLQDFFEYTGTSFSAPFAAAMAANSMSLIHSLQDDYDVFTQGALYKAMMIGTARDQVRVDDIQGFNNRYFVGEGGVDHLAHLTKSAFYNANNQSTIFSENINGKMCYTGWKATLSGSSHVRYVVAWFNRLSDHQIDSIPNSYTLEVLDPQGTPISFYNHNGNYSTVADAPNQGYQVVNFTLRDVSEGNYTARVCQTGVQDSNKAKFGFSASQVFFDYTPLPPGVMEVINSYLLFD